MISRRFNASARPKNFWPTDQLRNRHAASVLGHYGLWEGIAHRVKMLQERTDTGRALSPRDERKLLDAIAQSPSAALYPFFILSLDAGLRPAETRALRRRDLNLVWRVGVITRRGNYRRPLKDGSGERPVHSADATRLRGAHALAVALRRSRTGCLPISVSSRRVRRKRMQTASVGNRPQPSDGYLQLQDRLQYRTRKAAGVDYRLYDARHSFITRLAENPA